jgi:hypothetical protein
MLEWEFGFRALFALVNLKFTARVSWKLIGIFIKGTAGSLG